GAARRRSDGAGRVVDTGTRVARRSRGGRRHGRPRHRGPGDATGHQLSDTPVSETARARPRVALRRRAVAALVIAYAPGTAKARRHLEANTRVRPPEVVMERITMPQLGETVTEGTITRWLKAEGDLVEADESLFEVSTDKVDTEVPAAFGGFLRRILVPEG